MDVLEAQIAHFGKDAYVIVCCVFNAHLDAAGDKQDGEGDRLIGRVEGLELEILNLHEEIVQKTWRKGKWQTTIDYILFNKGTYEVWKRGIYVETKMFAMQFN